MQGVHPSSTNYCSLAWSACSWYWTRYLTRPGPLTAGWSHLSTWLVKTQPWVPSWSCCLEESRRTGWLPVLDSNCFGRFDWRVRLCFEGHLPPIRFARIRNTQSCHGQSSRRGSNDEQCVRPHSWSRVMFAPPLENQKQQAEHSTRPSAPLNQRSRNIDFVKRRHRRVLREVGSNVDVRSHELENDTRGLQVTTKTATSGVRSLQLLHPT